MNGVQLATVITFVIVPAVCVLVLTWLIIKFCIRLYPKVSQMTTSIPAMSGAKPRTVAEVKADLARATTGKRTLTHAQVDKLLDELAAAMMREAKVPDDLSGLVDQK